MAIDRTFGGAGAIWTSVPCKLPPDPLREPEQYYTGGTAVALGLGWGAGAPVLAVSGTSDPVTPPLPPRRQAWAVRFPPDGWPVAEGRSEGTQSLVVSPAGFTAALLGACDAPGGQAMLMKVGTSYRFVAVDWRTPGRITVNRPISTAWLFRAQQTR